MSNAGDTPKSDFSKTSQLGTWSLIHIFYLRKVAYLVPLSWGVIPPWYTVVSSKLLPTPWWGLHHFLLSGGTSFSSCCSVIESGQGKYVVGEGQWFNLTCFQPHALSAHDCRIRVVESAGVNPQPFFNPQKASGAWALEKRPRACRVQE